MLKKERHILILYLHIFLLFDFVLLYVREVKFKLNFLEKYSSNIAETAFSNKLYDIFALFKF